MLIADVRPTTLEGVKRLAKQIHKEKNVKHSIALDLAAKAAGCSNFRHAQRTLSFRRAVTESPYVLITVYWYDRKQQHRIGRETLKVELSKPILEICSKAAFKKVRGFENLRMVSEDHFVSDLVDTSQAYARQEICAAERSLRFMEHTGLRPLPNYRKFYPKLLTKDKLPNQDHVSYWIDPTNEQFILVDEPYAGVPNETNRAAWATRTNWEIRKTSWPGMYNPYSCDLYIATDRGTNYELDTLEAKINAMPAPLIVENWAGESSPSWETFLSPMAKTPQDIRRARCPGTVYPVASSTTVPYSYNLGSSKRRPAGKMVIADHIEAGRIIKAVVGSDLPPYGVYRRMSSLRSTLEDWMGYEIDPGQLEGPEFFEVYYRETAEDTPYKQIAESSNGIISMLETLKQKLEFSYPDCEPLRKQVHRIDMSLSLIKKTSTTRK